MTAACRYRFSSMRTAGYCSSVILHFWVLHAAARRCWPPVVAWHVFATLMMLPIPCGFMQATGGPHPQCLLCACALQGRSNASGRVCNKPAGGQAPVWHQGIPKDKPPGAALPRAQVGGVAVTVQVLGPPPVWAPSAGPTCRAVHTLKQVPSHTATCDTPCRLAQPTKPTRECGVFASRHA